VAKTDRDTLVQLATLYYLGDMSQEQLSQIMGISRTKVSRLLKQCREQKIVEFKINATDHIVGQLEEELLGKLGLRELHIVPSAASADESRRNVGKRAAQLLAASLRNNMMVGIAWGSTIREMVDQVVPAHLADNAAVIQLSGGFNLSSTDCNERELAKVLAMKLDARSYAFQAPILVQSPLLRSLFLKEPEIHRHFQLFDKVDMKGSYANPLTSRITPGSKIPLIMDNDRQAIRAAVKCCFDIDTDNPRIIHIHNTLCMGEFLISENLIPEAEAHPNIEVVGEPFEYDFDENGNLF